MGYRCEICKDACVGQMRRYVVKRPDGNIAKEVPVCEECQAALNSGYTLARVQAIRGPNRTDDTSLPRSVAETAPPPVVKVF